MRLSLSRTFFGFFLICAAVATRCLAAVHGGVVMTFGPHLPALTRIDFVTAPVALIGVGVLAGSRGLRVGRRLAGTVALVVAIGWPAIKFGDISPVVLSLSARHGVHTHDVVAFPVLAASMALLAPWRSALRPWRGFAPAVLAAAVRPAVRH